MSGKAREGEKMRVNLNFIVWFDVQSSIIPFISFPFPPFLYSHFLPFLQTKHAARVPTNRPNNTSLLQVYTMN